MNDPKYDININDEDVEKLFENIDYKDQHEQLKKIEIKYKKNWCNTCSSNSFIIEDYSQGIIVCTNCGNVINEIMDKSPEWNTYDNSKSNSRCTAPINTFLPKSSLGTTIACSSYSKVSILHKWNAMPYRERSLLNVLKEIEYRCRKGKIIKCIEDDAKILYKNISACKHPKGKNKGKYIIIRGNNRKGLIAACIFFACKRKGNTRSPKEIGNLFELKCTEITRGIKTFTKLIKISNLTYEFISSTPEQFIPRYCKRLHFKKKYINEAIKIAKNIQKLSIASVHTPLSIATGSILLIVDTYNLNISKKYIAKEFKVSEVTISKAYHKIESYKDIIVDDEITNKYAKELEKFRKTLKIPEHLKNRYNRLDELDEIDEFDESDEKKVVLFKKIKKIFIDPINGSIDSYVAIIDSELYDNLQSTEDEYAELFN